jgi:monothiol glutaredoxin
MEELTTIESIKDEIKNNDVVLFMKGSPMFPQCGFSAAFSEILTSMDVKFKGIDVLQNMELREEIKQFSNWPTIPQLYINGEFVGGCDIIREMANSGELHELLDEKLQ